MEKEELLKSDANNAWFLINKLSKNKRFEWSKIHPYTTEIDGKHITFKNSYEAHLAKHPKHKSEKSIWKDLLDNYPNDIDKKYIEFSNILISESDKSKWEYDDKNHSINFTNKDNIRVSLKRSIYNNEEAVISTCHPRIKKYNYSEEFNYSTGNYFNLCNFQIPENEKLIEYVFKPMDHPFFRENKECKEKLDRIIDNYFVEVFDEINKLEFFDSKYNLYELSDAYDYNEITEYIDKLFLCYTYHKKFEGESSLYYEYLNRFINIDKYNNIESYINNKEYLHGLDDSKSFNYLLLNSDNNKYIYSQKKLDFVNTFEEVIKDERENGNNIDLSDKNVRAYGKSYEISDKKFSAGRSATDKNYFTGKELFVFCKHNHVSLDNAKKLFAYVGIFLPFDIMIEIYNEWDTPYSVEKMEEIVEYIDKFIKPCK